MQVSYAVTLFAGRYQLGMYNVNFVQSQGPHVAEGRTLYGLPDMILQHANRQE